MDNVWRKPMCCYSSHYLSCYCIVLCTLHSPLIIIFILFNYKLIRLCQYDKLPILHISASWIFANNHLFLFHIHKSAEVIYDFSHLVCHSNLAIGNVGQSAFWSSGWTDTSFQTYFSMHRYSTLSVKPHLIKTVFLF